MAGQNHMACCCGTLCEQTAENEAAIHVYDPAYGWNPPLTVRKTSIQGTFNFVATTNCGGTVPVDAQLEQLGYATCFALFDVPQKVSYSINGLFRNWKWSATHEAHIFRDSAGAILEILVGDPGTDNPCATVGDSVSTIELIVAAGQHEFIFRTFGWTIEPWGGIKWPNCAVSFSVTWEDA